MLVGLSLASLPCSHASFGKEFIELFVTGATVLRNRGVSFVERKRVRLAPTCGHTADLDLLVDAFVGWTLNCCFSETFSLENGRLCFFTIASRLSHINQRGHLLESGSYSSMAHHVLEMGRDVEEFQLSHVLNNSFGLLEDVGIQSIGFEGTV